MEIRVRKGIRMFLEECSPRKKYYSRSCEEKEEIRHWGQRKLLLCETWFLLKYGDLSCNVIYAGAAPGQHLEYLSSMFRNHNFYLYDPNEFRIDANNRMRLFRKCFTDEEATGYREVFKGDYLFISDIRTANYKEMSPIENERAVLKDNELQMEWTRILRPRKAMLKFRCAYPTEIANPTVFFKGDILIQPWAP